MYFVKVPIESSETLSFAYGLGLKRLIIITPFPLHLQIINHNILVVLAMMFPDDFTPEVHVSVDKFLAKLALALSEKYR